MVIRSDGTPPPQERLFTDERGRIFVTITLGVAVAKTGRYVIPALLPSIIDSLRITNFKAGIALSVITFVFALAQYPGGRLSDQLSRKSIIVSSLAVLIVGFALFATSLQFSVFLVAAVLIGFSDGMYSPPANALVSDLFVRRRSQAYGIHMTALDIGGLVAAGLATFVLAYLTWRWAFLPIVVVLAILLGLVHLWGTESYSFGRVPLHLRGVVRHLASDRRLLWLLLAYGLFAFVFQGVINFLPTLLRVDYGFSAAGANALFGGLFVVGLVAKPLAGRFNANRRGLPLAVFLCLVTAGGLAGIVVSRTVVVISGAVLLFGIGQKSFGPVVRTYLMDSFADETRGGEFGAVRTVFLGIGSFGPLYVGTVVGIASYTVAFAGLVVCLVSCALIMLALSLTDDRSGTGV